MCECVKRSEFISYEDSAIQRLSIIIIIIIVDYTSSRAVV